MAARKLAIVIVGHVDHGKSTLIGRLFHDTNSLPEGKLEQIRAASEAEGMEFEFAFLLDALLEEQAQNITIDTTRLPFRTARREYVIIDAPGHKEFLKNMVTGAASADAAILLIDAQEGVQEQSRRHAHLLSMLGIGQVIVAVNKMDLADYSRERFEAVREEFSGFLGKLGISPIHFLPISAKHGDNIASPSAAMPWHQGPTVLEALDGLPDSSEPGALPLRFVLQDIYRFDERRILAGRIESGSLRVGSEIAFWPDGKRSRVKSIETWGSRPAPPELGAGAAAAITLEEQIFVERGQVGAPPGQGPYEGREFHASLFWLGREPLVLDRPFTLKLGTQSVEARLVEITRVLDSSTLEPIAASRGAVGRNEVADVRIRARRPLAFDRHDVIGPTGRFVVMEGRRIGGGGIVRDTGYAAEAPRVASDNITWTISPVTREARAQHFGHRGVVLWLTGLSGSGKSTLATGLDSALHRRGVASTILDGDNLRHGLCSNLGFSPEDRSENIRRAGETAKLMAEAGLVVICSLISPFRADRQRVRDICARDGVPFAEIFINAPIEVCEARDPRGLYKRARAGEIPNFTGIASPYEPPTQPDLEIPTAELPIEKALERLLEFTAALVRLAPVQHAGRLAPGEGI
ncbi:MAG: adenylyl-sulfate kinase [Terrimicrobiaceae bacterium]|nr:adenylyl-sulfate kinase [Terrimicrobiaceae bacterium]